MQKFKERRKWCICIPRVRSFVHPATDGIESETLQTLGLQQHHKKNCSTLSIYQMHLQNLTAKYIIN